LPAAAQTFADVLQALRRVEAHGDFQIRTMGPETGQKRRKLASIGSFAEINASLLCKTRHRHR
jgi:hypothetical protein